MSTRPSCAACSDSRSWGVTPPHAELEITLPAYPWERGRPGADGTESCGRVHSDGPVGHPLLGERAAVAEPTWHGVLDVVRMPWIASSKAGGFTALPAAAFVEAALAAGAAGYDCAELEVIDLKFERALVFAAAEIRGETLFQVGLCPDSGIVRMSSRAQATAQWRLHARGRVRRLYGVVPVVQELGGVRESYQVDEPTEEYFVHPVLIDTAFQCVVPTLAETFGRCEFVPAAVERVRLRRRPEKSGFIHARARLLDARESVWDLSVTDESGEVCLELTGLRLRRSGSVAEAQEPVRYYATELRAAPYSGVPAAPVVLPMPAELLAATAQRRREFTGRHDNRYDEIAPLVKLAAAHFAAAAFAEILAGQREFGLNELRIAGVGAEFEGFVGFLVRSACRHGLLEQVEGGSVVGAWPVRWHFAKRPQPNEIFRHLLRRFPDWSLTITLAGRYWLRLSEILRGELDLREVLADDADRRLAESVYEDSPALRAHSNAVREIVAEVVRHWPADRSLRVLEVGARGPSASLSSVLPPERTWYECADISDRRFTQGFGPGEFDLVIVGNTLRRAVEPVAAVQRVSELLADGGLLLMAEQTDPEFSASLVGVLGDVSESSTSSRVEWPGLLDSCGYGEVAQTGGADASVIVARRSERVQVIVTPPCMPTDGYWVVGAEDSEGDLAQELGVMLTEVGARCATVVELGSDRTCWNETLRVRDGADVNVVLLFGKGNEGSEDGAVDLTARRLVEVQTIARELGGLPEATKPRLWLVTRPTGLFPEPERAQDPVGAAVWGAGQVLAGEYPQVGVRRISLEPGPDPRATAHRLARELLEPSGADEVVLTGADRFVPRVRNCSPMPRSVVVAAGAAFRLELRDPGPAHQLVWVPDRPPIPGRGEVLIRVRAAAINHRDAMLANGLLPADAENLASRGPARDVQAGAQIGLECAGDVVAAGPGVAEFAPGDRVFALGARCMASHVLARVGQVGRMPNRMRYAEAATLPVVFLATQRSLEQLARLAPHETLLVHGASGGVGLAAIQYAHSLGARVVATAGSPAKRDLLRLLGVGDVFDSRSHAFAEQVLVATGGSGVDVVLNSLVGEGVARSLECLRPGGRFVDLGKRDVDGDRSVLLRSFRDNISFFGVDVLRLALQRPDHAKAQFAQLAQRVADGVYHPIPHQVYPAARVGDALRALEGSRHVGKVVVEFGEPVPIERAGQRLRLRGEERQLPGIANVAMHVGDVPPAELTAERMRAILEPTLRSMEVLDTATRDRPVDQFVTYRAESEQTGNLSQLPYMAVTCVLEAMTRARRAAGLPGLAMAVPRSPGVGHHEQLMEPLAPIRDNLLTFRRD